MKDGVPEYEEGREWVLKAMAVASKDDSIRRLKELADSEARASDFVLDLLALHFAFEGALGKDKHHLQKINLCVAALRLHPDPFQLVKNLTNL